MKDLEKLGLTGVKQVFHNISYEELFKHEVANKEGEVSSNGTFCVDTGIFTGRSRAFRNASGLASAFCQKYVYPPTAKRAGKF